MEQNELTLAEFDALLVAYEKQNPVKYEAKLASGEFNAFKATLKKKTAPVEEESEVEQPKKGREKKK